MCTSYGRRYVKNVPAKTLTPPLAVSESYAILNIYFFGPRKFRHGKNLTFFIGWSTPPPLAENSAKNASFFLRAPLLILCGNTVPATGLTPSPDH